MISATGGISPYYLSSYGQKVTPAIKPTVYDTEKRLEVGMAGRKDCTLYYRGFDLNNAMIEKAKNQNIKLIKR